MVRQEIFGREKKLVDKLGTKGCCYLGKVVSYPAGKYEESGAVYLDVTSPHCMLVLGKRGTGKSYTLGVIAEAFGLLEKEYKERIAVLIVDTMSVFQSLKCANTNAFEVGRLKDFGDLTPMGLEDYVKVFIPKLTADKLQEDGHSIAYDEFLQLPIKDIDVHDWLSLFTLKPTEPAGVILMKVIDELLRSQQPFGYEEIYAEVDRQKADDYIKESLKNLFRVTEELKIFDKVGTPYSSIVKGGQLSVLDISYLGRVGGFDVRNLIVEIVGKRLLSERTLYTTLEMQSEAKLIDEEISKDIIKEHPLVYMIIDEAHLFLPSNERTLATDVLIDWIKLGRHPGLSLILATQEPSALHESAIRQSDIMIAHNVTSSDDVAALGKAKQSFMTGSQDIQKIVSTMEFKKGLAVMFDDKTRKIEMCRVRPRLTIHSGVDASAVPPEVLQRHEPQPSEEAILTIKKKS
jgi:Cdc6-like AAA superfamily ATPase